MSPARQARVRAERLGLDWAAEPSEHGLADVSPSAMEVARSRLSLLPDDRRLLASASDEDLLRGLGVLLADGRLTRAGALLCCRDVEGRNATLVYQYRATQGGEPRLVERRGPPLLTAFTRVMELVTARLNTAPLQLPGGQRVDLEDFPREAVREGLANAVLHRDYLVDDPVTVEHSPETLVITSPGPLVSGVTPDNILTHPSKPRNPAMARALRTLGLAEETGRGVDRIYREVIRSGKDEPHIDATFERVRLPLVGGAPSTRIARLLATLPQRERDDVDTMLVLLRLRDRRTTTAKALAPVLQKSTAEAEVVLRRLAGEDVALVEPTRATARRAHPSYQLRSRVVQQLGPAISYHRRSPDDIDRKVVAHVREYGRITNRTIRDLFDVDVYRARTLLADLVRREILTPPERRGPGVTYEAGPKFPKR